MYVLVDDRYGKAMSTPKMRSLKQLVLNLQLWNNNSFVDGIKVEVTHQLGKDEQSKHCNHKYDWKQHVTRQSAHELRTKYAMNGGRWGPNFEYRLGDLARHLKDPKNPHLPNPAIINYLIPKSTTPQDRIEITGCFAHTKGRQAWGEIHAWGHRQSLMKILQKTTGQQDLQWKDLGRHEVWSASKIKTFRFHDSHRSFAMNFSPIEGQPKPKCIVKVGQQWVCEFDTAFMFTVGVNISIPVGIGFFYRIQKSRTPSQWLDDKFNSMDYINKSQTVRQWFHFKFISEPVFLIHNCVPFAEIKRTLPDKYQRFGKLYFYRHFGHNMKQLHQAQRRRQRNRNQMQLPCGPIHVCSKHERVHCRNCQSRKPLLKWKCNTEKHPHFWVFDAANGLCMTLMKTVHKQSKNVRYQW